MSPSQTFDPAVTALIFFHAGLPGSTIFLAMRSASMTGTPSSRNIFPTVLFPVATPPVNPTRNIAAAAAAERKSSEFSDHPTMTRKIKRIEGEKKGKRSTCVFLDKEKEG